MAYRHGVYIQEVPTQLVPPVRTDAALPVVFGTAPVHALAEGVARPVNEPRLIFTMQEFVKTFGALPEGASAHDYTLHEFASIYFGTYRVAPIVCVNVFDPLKHKDDQDKPDVSRVTSADIIGGVTADHKRTGLELIDEVFPRFRLLPGNIVAPGFSGDPAVALLMGAKSANINGHFRAHAIIDIPSEVPHYTDAPAWLNDNNLIDPNLSAFFGQPLLGEAPQWGSAHLAAGLARRDSAHEDIPYWSASNTRLLANGLIHAGEELALGPQEAAWLNGSGIVTGINFIGGMRLWGNRTTAYPGTTDPKDTFLCTRRMFNWVGNQLVLQTWSRVDNPMNRRLVESVVDSNNRWLNGLVARQFLNGAKVVFLSDENPTTDLMDGIIRFHVYMAPPPPAREIEFILEYEPSYLNSLFG